eukprot:jgi/Ulvmu1/10090/UM006_0037.1
MNLNVCTCAVVYALNAKAVGIVASVTEGSELVPELESYYSATATADGHGPLSAYASMVNDVQVLQCSQWRRYRAHKQAMVSRLRSHQRVADLGFRQLCAS